MLDEHLECRAHPVRPKQMNRCVELRAILFQLRNHLFDIESHEKTHLVREAGRLESLFFTGRR